MTMIVRRSGVTPSRSSNPGRIFPPTCRVIARLTIAIATSEAGTKPTIARTRSGQAAIPIDATAMQYERENDRGDDRDHAHIAAHAQIGIEMKEPGPERHPAPQFPLERAAAPGDEVISRIAFPPVRGNLFGRLVRRASGGGYRVPGHVHFVTVRFAREFLDRAPVTVACRKIHRREIAGAAQYRVDRTDAFEEFRPIDRRDQAHAHDDIANASRPLRSGAETPRARSGRWSSAAAANLSFSQRSAGVVSGSWSRRRWASSTANAVDQGA